MNIWTERFLRCTTVILHITIGITIVAQPKFESPKSRFIWLLDVTFTTLTVDETDTKIRFWLIKIKRDNAKQSLSLLECLKVN